MNRISLGMLSIACVALTAAPATAQPIGACIDLATYVSPDGVAEQNFRQGLRYFDQKQYGAALPYLTQAAQRNHPRAQELMDQVYMFGLGVTPDAKQALRYMTASAAQGHRGAMKDAGAYYSYVEVDLLKANRYFLAAAQCGELESMVELGLNYELARGVAWNRQQAIYWLSRAAPHWGQAQWIVDGLRQPGTPRFQNVDQLFQYIARSHNAPISHPSSGFPRPGTPSCYQSVSVYCVGDPTSLAYRRAHGQ